MKMHYAELKHRSRLLQSLTGLNTAEFEGLLASFGEAWQAFEEATFERKRRQRARGAGRKAELTGWFKKGRFWVTLAAQIRPSTTMA